MSLASRSVERSSAPDHDPVTASPAASRPTAARRRGVWSKLWRDRVLILFCLPGLAVIIGFHYLPLLGNVIAFKDYQPFLGIAGSDWSGLDNFAVIFGGDSQFLNALKNTLILTALQSVFVFPAPILLALLLNSLLSESIKRIVQSVLYLPHFLSWVMVVALFQSVLGGSGLLNNFLRAHDLDTLSIIGNPDTFRILLTSQVIWKDTGWATILFLAALSQIDAQLYEAASVDGAGRTRQLWHVTLPGLKPIIILLFILRLGDSLTVGFEQIILQQQAVGRDVSEVLDTYVYNNGIIAGDWGASAAVGLVKGIVGVVLVLTANKIAHIFGEEGVYQR
ncbi:ABC transporter permease [Microlunatus soli]|uniref:Carbohydrate ABC transporter membrane protein 1, CUT1 family n=1 Tax=Microlunatus soli TaxID=630515 RepID=A0A1H1YJS0_9ACTN|nr:ABC transporter permease subunit [Microlunatus soli]SDT21662.1 carbohydrate ABC transporter membrane protein 1, CUT1 family [Microlunatus soli]